MSIIFSSKKNAKVSIKICTAQFLISFKLFHLCTQYEAQTLQKLHISFNNMNKIKALIHKQQLLNYSVECDFKSMCSSILSI